MGNDVWHKLMEAALDEDKAKLDQLVFELRGVGLDTVNKQYGQAVLHVLARIGGQSVRGAIKMLIGGDANVNASDLKGIDHILQKLFNRWADVHASDDKGPSGSENTQSQDFLAILESLSRQGIERLIEKGANVNVRALKTGRTPLHFATLGENARLVQKLIELDADVHARDNNRPSGSESTPLHLVAQYGSDSSQSIDILKLLVKHGGSTAGLLNMLNIKDADGDTPLHCAALNSDPAMLKEVLEIFSTGSEPNVERLESSAAASSMLVSVLNLANKEGETPLHHAVNKSSADTEKIRLLLEVGAAVDSRDSKGVTPLHLAVGKCSFKAIRLFLRLAGAAFSSTRDAWGANAFHYAARVGSVKALRMLKKKLDVNDQATKNGLTALHYAAWNKRNEAVKWLLEHKASVDAIDKLKGDTPLHLAARRGDADVIETLIQKGANTQLTNHKGSLALGLADDRGQHGAAEAFVKAIRKKNKQDHGFLRSLLISHSGNGATLLHYFAAYGTEEDMEWIFKMIKRKKTSFDPKSTSDTHQRQQCKVNMPDKSNRTAVHWAAMRGNTDTLKVLAKNGADLNADVNGANLQNANAWCQTPLYFALRDGKIPFADALMRLKLERPRLREDDWTSDIGKWMIRFCRHDDTLTEKLQTLQHVLTKHKYPKHKDPPSITDDELLEDIPPIYLALYLAKRVDVAIFIQQQGKREDDAVNARGKHCGKTALHWATLMGERKIVAQLCRNVFKDDLVANVEDKDGKTALQYAKEMVGSSQTQNEELKDIEKELMQRSDVSAHIEGLFKDRQVYVDAANAILVGAALIAGVTFAGWLQPPLGYASYYNLPKVSGAEGVYQTYAAIQQHVGVRWFCIVNALSFSFAIATLVAGLLGVVPIPGVYIATSVAHLRRCTLIAAALLGISIAFGLSAFAAAEFAVLPPLFQYQALMLTPTIGGALPCLLLLAVFCRRVAPLLPNDVKLTMREVLCSSSHHNNNYGGQSSNTQGADASAQTYTVVMERPASASRRTSEVTSQAVNDDYTIGKDYEVIPWHDGLNIVSEILPYRNIRQRSG